jgi:triosephosphate isomerase
MRRKIVAGNWKLHGDRQFALDLMEALASHQVPAGVERIILPPLPYLGELVEHFGERGFEFGAQDVSAREKGAYTGEVSAAMLKDVGARYGWSGIPSVASTTARAASWWRASSWPPRRPGWCRSCASARP